MSRRERFDFTGSQGASLAALLETPDEPADKAPVATALFAHCFTCGKDSLAASRIARALVARGFAVMRFDFTGLGGSDGDFANTHFSSNVQDLVAAADHLRKQGMAPSLLIGHSLGGAAVLSAAHEIPECRAIVTIAAPADARHVARQFACDIDTIEREGEAEVQLAGRPFTIRKSFLDDIRNTDTAHIRRLRRALLVMHSPTDSTVDIGEAERIYSAALHPKSFVTLDGADHLLTTAADASYVADVIAAWSSRPLAGKSAPTAGSQPVPTAETSSGADKVRPSVESGEILVRESDHRFLLDVFSDDHQWRADEPSGVGGGNAGPDPYEHLLAALGSCTVMTLRMYANHKSLPLTDVTVTLRHSREHAADCEHCDDSSAKIDVISRDIVLHGELSEAQRTRLMQIADRCPVHRTLTGTLKIRSTLVS